MFAPDINHVFIGLWFKRLVISFTNYTYIIYLYYNFLFFSVCYTISMLLDSIFPESWSKKKIPGTISLGISRQMSGCNTGTATTLARCPYPNGNAVIAPNQAYLGPRQDEKILYHVCRLLWIEISVTAQCGVSPKLELLTGRTLQG